MMEKRIVKQKVWLLYDVEDDSIENIYDDGKAIPAFSWLRPVRAIQTLEFTLPAKRTFQRGRKQRVG
jgi:hypothetical protein